MKKVFKKNQLIITALALMIAVAGYLSFTDKNGKDEKVAMEASADTADLSYEISAEDDLAEADIFTDTEDNSSEAVSAADSVVEESLENPGEAVTNPRNIIKSHTRVIGGFRPLAGAHPQPPALGVRAAKNG